MSPELAAILYVPFMFSPNLAHQAPGVQVGESPVPLETARIEDLGPGGRVDQCASRQRDPGRPRCFLPEKTTILA